MEWKKKIAGGLCVSCLALGGLPAGLNGPICGTVAEAEDYSSGEYVLPHYWISRCRNADQVVLRPEHIRYVNGEILKKAAGSVADLASCPELIAAGELHSRMRAAMKEYSGWELPELYRDGELLSWEDWKAVKDNCGFEIPIRVRKVLYGVTVDRTNIRCLPVSEGWYESPRQKDIDVMQEAVLSPAEPVAVLTESVDKKYLFVQGRNTVGWAEASSIALTSREHWMKYAAPAGYAVITAKERTVTADRKQLTFPMGTRLPVKEQAGEVMTVLLPVREKDNTLGERELRLPSDNTVHSGTLPYSRENLLRQAFRCLGEPADGKGTVMTDASFVVGVYRSVGIELPLSREKQEQVMPTVCDLTDLNDTDRYAAFFDVKPASLLFQPGHVMFYLGRGENGLPMVIHAVPEGVTVSDLYDDAEGLDRMRRLTSIGTIP